MKLLFVHQNFPGQFQHLAPSLQREGCQVKALHMRASREADAAGIESIRYVPRQGSTPGVHSWARDLETKVIRGEACFRQALHLRSQGFEPDAIVAHPGWGEALFLKDVWPKAKLGVYCEFYYHPVGADTGFDPEFPSADPAGDPCRLRLKNLNQDLHMAAADAGLSPTQWQASTYPQPFQGRITVAHDGIDTQAISPNAHASLTLKSGLRLTRHDEVITFVNRNLEPYRGCHTFLRALPQILRRRPQAHVLIVGGDGVSYGAAPPAGQTWKQVFVGEIRPQVSDQEWSRVHFVGEVPHRHFVMLLQLSSVHVYLTYPFVLSWSLLEAMSAGACVVASDTAPVQEVIAHDVNGRMVNFFDITALANQVCGLLEDPATRLRLGQAARDKVCERYDLTTVCLPAQKAWVRSLA